MDLLRSLYPMKFNRFETTIWAAKIVLLTLGTISAAILFKAVIVPCTISFIFSTFPPLLVSARSWLSLPFLYIIVNFIIISIAVSSNFPKRKQASSQLQTNSKCNESTTPTNTEDAALEGIHESDVTEHSDNPREEVKEGRQLEETQETHYDSALSCEKSDTNLPPEKSSGTHHSDVTSYCDNPREVQEQPPEKIFSNAALSYEKLDTNPLLEQNSRDYVSPDSDEKCDDMEATWKAIMDRQGKQVTWKLKKSDTWGETTKAEPLHESQVAEDDHVAWARRELRKSDTFNDTASLKRDKSISPEELYRQAEAFIQKINNQMRLQRLESERRFMEMVNHGLL